MANILKRGAGLVNKYGILGVTAGVGLGTTAIGGLQGFREHSQDGFQDRAAWSVNYGLHYGAIGAATAAAGLTAVRYAPWRRASWDGVAKTIGKPFSPYINSWRAAMKEKTLAGGLLGHAPVTGTIGALLGGVIGANLSDDPTQGAMIGAGVGTVGALAARSFYRGNKAWNMVSKVPGGKTAVLALAAGGTAAVARSFLHQPDYESVDMAEPDETGAYAVTSGGMKSRLNMMNATGDLVFGLNAGRH